MTETPAERRTRLRSAYLVEHKSLIELAAGEQLSKQRVWAILTNEGRDRGWMQRIKRIARKRRIAFLRSFNDLRKTKP